MTTMIDTSKRYTGKELAAMTNKERYDERIKCSKEKNVLGQRDIFTYDFVHYGISTSKASLLAIAFLYARTCEFDTFEKLIKDNSFLLLDLNPNYMPIVEFMLTIGSKYPYLSEDELKQLEELYNDTRYCGIIDELLFDKERLPRSIKGITHEELNKTNENFSNSLLELVYCAFEENSEVEDDDEDTIWRVYDRRNNTIISKEYNRIGAGECVADGTIDAHVFFDLIEEKYGEECLYFFVKKVMELNPYLQSITKEKFRTLENQWVDYRYLSNLVKDRWNSYEVPIDLKRLIALSFLLKINKLNK